MDDPIVLCSKTDHMQSVSNLNHDFASLWHTFCNLLYVLAFTVRGRPILVFHMSNMQPPSKSVVNNPWNFWEGHGS